MKPMTLGVCEDCEGPDEVLYNGRCLECHYDSETWDGPTELTGSN